MAKCLPNIDPGFNPQYHKINEFLKIVLLCTMAHASNSNTWESEAGGLQIQS
jgi:hypothetical protein